MIFLSFKHGSACSSCLLHPLTCVELTPGQAVGLLRLRCTHENQLECTWLPCEVP